MVITSESTPAALNTSSVPLKRTSLKKRRGLSSFYASKSQSFHCLLDLQSNPWSQSSLVLAKVMLPAVGEHQSDLLSMHPDGCVSEPGSPQAHHSLARHSWPSSPEADDGEAPCGPALVPSWHGIAPEAWHPHLEQQQQPQPLMAPPLGPYDGSGRTDVPLAGSRCSSLGPSLSGSSEGSMSSMDATCDASFEAMGDAYCCLHQHQQQPTDGLCEALKAASLAAARHTPQAAVLLPLAASCGLHS